ncbi:MAG: phosphopantetheine-binding protein [Myxococcota bacterium]|nr:phosphopantetheine-binding protein [Myxococcota bacterium]
MASLRFRLTKVFREVLDEDDLVLPEDPTEEIEGWDSLAHVELMMALESEFDVALTNEETAEMTSIPAIEQVLSGHGVEVGG